MPRRLHLARSLRDALAFLRQCDEKGEVRYAIAARAVATGGHRMHNGRALIRCAERFHNGESGRRLSQLSPTQPSRQSKTLKIAASAQRHAAKSILICTLT